MHLSLANHSKTATTHKIFSKWKWLHVNSSNKLQTHDFVSVTRSSMVTYEWFHNFPNKYICIQYSLFNCFSSSFYTVQSS